MQGIKIGNWDHKISLFADVILFQKQLDTCKPAMLALIDLFHKLSGYKINASKSALTALDGV